MVSDGSNYLFVWDSETHEEKRRIEVKTSAGDAVNYLNELQYYKGDILANVWYTDVIVRIDLNTGIVKVVYDFKDLWPKRLRHEGADCFNGIALMENGDLMVTGKNWDSMYRVRLDGD